jgi:hypothetical protein
LNGCLDVGKEQIFNPEMIDLISRMFEQKLLSYQV